MKFFRELFELVRLGWYLMILLPALPELIEQGKYEEDPEGYRPSGLEEAVQKGEIG